MTTPEAFRRRQRREGYALIFLGIIVSLGFGFLSHQQRQQGDCVVKNFSNLSASLTARGGIASRESRAARIEGRATRLESKANNDFYKAAFSAADTADVFDAYGRYRVALAHVQTLRQQVDKRRERIATDRAQNPIPAFPEGTCE